MRSRHVILCFQLLLKVVHDKLVDLKMATTEEDLQGVYAKACGYTARLAMVLDIIWSKLCPSLMQGQPPSLGGQQRMLVQPS